MRGWIAKRKRLAAKWMTLNEAVKQGGDAGS
jgi:hypothetical protein